MPERINTNITTNELYRYAYNGMEVDNEVSGNGNSYTTEFRQYDPRLGRWKSLDPHMSSYPEMSPYVAFNNNPIYFNDPKGLDGEPVVSLGESFESLYKSEIGKVLAASEYFKNVWNQMEALVQGNPAAKVQFEAGDTGGSSENGGQTVLISTFSKDLPEALKDMDPTNAKRQAMIKRIFRDPAGLDLYFNEAKSRISLLESIGLTVNEAVNLPDKNIAVFISGEINTPEERMKVMRTIFHEIIEHVIPYLNDVTIPPGSNTHHKNAVDFDNNVDFFTPEESLQYTEDLLMTSKTFPIGTDYTRSPEGSIRNEYSNKIEALYKFGPWEEVSTENTMSTGDYYETGEIKTTEQRTNAVGDVETRTKVKAKF